MASITFTKNVTPSNRKNGEYLLGVYWRASPLSKAPNYPITNWQGLLKFYDTKYPTFIEWLGEQLGSITSDRMLEVMKTVAAQKNLSYPIPARFAEQIGLQIGTVDTGQVLADTASEVGTDLVNFTQSAFFWVLVLAGGAFALAVYTRSGGKIKLPKLGKIL